MQYVKHPMFKSSYNVVGVMIGELWAKKHCHFVVSGTVSYALINNLLPISIQIHPKCFKIKLVLLKYMISGLSKDIMCHVWP